MSGGDAGKNSEEDLSRFLAKVDQIEELVKDLATSSDHASSARALERAEEYITKESSNDPCKFPEDRTLVNTASESCPKGGVAPPPLEGDAGQNAFLRSLEEDARERGERRKERERRGKEAKRCGVQAFKASDYEGAVGHFTTAISEAPWDITLYTNRASTYNKLARFPEAVEDCDRAIQFEPNTLKAYIHKGNALRGLKDLEAAKCCFTEALELFPEKAEQIKPYLLDL